jgi:hypothetical protein
MASGTFISVTAGGLLDGKRSRVANRIFLTTSSESFFSVKYLPIVEKVGNDFSEF